MPVIELAVVFICIACGGILKGATGAGAPILAIPALAAFHDVRFAIVVMTVPNIVSNAVQAWQNREHHLRPAFILPFLISASVGVMLGTWALVWLDPQTMSLVVALAVLLYLILRLTKANWHLRESLAMRLAAPFGLLSGMVQGSSGLSAPVSLSFLNAMHLERRVFMNTLSMLFITFGSVQLPALAFAGVLTPFGFLLSCLALIPMFIGMPLGAFIARKVSRVAFDRMILLLLGVLAARMLWEALIPASYD